MDYINVIKYDDCKIFLNDILPGNKLWRDISHCIFRGESNSNYKLLPGVLRDNVAERFKNLSFKFDSQASESEYAFIGQEIDLLKKFYKIANENGRYVPTIDSFNQDYDDDMPLIDRNLLGGENWPSPKFLDLICLAQHHGIPTRLIDWTYNVYVALYFASLSATTKNIMSGYITIYALSPTMLKYVLDRNYKLKFYVAPYCTNENIKLQNGILSYYEIENIFSKNIRSQLVNKEPHDILLSKQFEKDDLNMAAITKFLLPAEQSKIVFTYISRLGYTASRLFEGHDGVIKEMQERQFILND